MENRRDKGLGPSTPVLNYTPDPTDASALLNRLLVRHAKERNEQAATREAEARGLYALVEAVTSRPSAGSRSRRNSTATDEFAGPTPKMTEESGVSTFPLDHSSRLRSSAAVRGSTGVVVKIDARPNGVGVHAVLPPNIRLRVEFCLDGNSKVRIHTQLVAPDHQEVNSEVEPTQNCESTSDCECTSCNLPTLRKSTVEQNKLSCLKPPESSRTSASDHTARGVRSLPLDTSFTITSRSAFTTK